MRGSRTRHDLLRTTARTTLTGILRLASGLVEYEHPDIAAALRHLLVSSIRGSPLQAVADRLIVTVLPLRPPLT